MEVDTELFITEIERRPCIWNSNIEEYNNRVFKQNAWKEIAEVIYEDWSSLEEKHKIKKVQYLQKKWKGLRDYFKRKKNVSVSLNRGNAPLRKRKSPFLNMLHFLNIPTNPLSNIKEEHTGYNNTFATGADLEDQSSPSSSPYHNTNVQPITPYQKILLRSEVKMDDPDMNFLLNILPDMKSMTSRQNFEFRFGVMKLIRNIKYNEHRD